MSSLDIYDYNLPPELIAHAPAWPRDSARLMVYDTKTDIVSFCTIRDLFEKIPSSLIVVNDTKVLPARIAGEHKDESIELLVLVDQGFSSDGMVRALVNRRVRSGEQVLVNGVTFTVIEDHEKSMLLRANTGKRQLLQLLHDAGETPLPPYISSEFDEEQRRVQYQSMFAVKAPSVAAPTASLHFTPELVRRLTDNGSEFASVTLQVGLGTFAPVFEEHFESRQLHTERYVVPRRTANAIAATSRALRPVLAVGTTVVRTLEAAKRSLATGRESSGVTDLFIYPPHHFTYPDLLMTNFHVPRSSLMCLVEAYLQHKGAKSSLVELYQLAIAERLRFYSFGDAMLIL